MNERFLLVLFVPFCGHETYARLRQAPAGDFEVEAAVVARPLVGVFLVRVAGDQCAVVELNRSAETATAVLVVGGVLLDDNYIGREIEIDSVVVFRSDDGTKAQRTVLGTLREGKK